MASAVAETLTPSIALASEGVTGASISDALSTINFEIIDLDATELPNNDREGLILCHVVRRGEVQTHRVPHVLPEG
jgi:hypothetical protein